uniref:Uncharacterized protein n=1 Tax=Cacopsylla melanoneura TaxID=428564 RepID=A0A8D9EAC3_9HEMI
MNGVGQVSVLIMTCFHPLLHVAVTVYPWELVYIILVSPVSVWVLLILFTFCAVSFQRFKAPVTAQIPYVIILDTIIFSAGSSLDNVGPMVNFTSRHWNYCTPECPSFLLHV